MSDDVIWEAPPPKQKRSKYRPILNQIRERPGRWARVAIGTDNSNAWSRAGSVKNAIGEEQGWELEVARLEDESGWGVWVRYTKP